MSTLTNAFPLINTGSPFYSNVADNCETYPAITRVLSSLFVYIGCQVKSLPFVPQAFKSLVKRSYIDLRSITRPVCYK